MSSGPSSPAVLSKLHLTSPLHSSEQDGRRLQSTSLRSPLALTHETGVLRAPGWTVSCQLTPPWSACAVMNDPEARPTQPQRQLRSASTSMPSPSAGSRSLASVVSPVWSPRSCRRPSWRRSARGATFGQPRPAEPAGTLQPFPHAWSRAARTPPRSPGPGSGRWPHGDRDRCQPWHRGRHRVGARAARLRGAVHVPAGGRSGRSRHSAGPPGSPRARRSAGHRAGVGPGEGARSRWRPTCRTPRRPAPCSTRPRSIWAR